MPSDSIPPPPWVLHGEAVAFLAPRLRLRLLVNYHKSPVGPYHEHALATLTWRGPSVVQMGVDLEASLVGGRRNWGYPKVLERLAWYLKGKNIIFSRKDKTFRIRKTYLRLPLALPFWTIQELNGQVVRVPATLRGIARLGFRGRQLALILDEFEMKFEAPQPL
jgi:hypothetical protein